MKREPDPEEQLGKAHARRVSIRTGTQPVLSPEDLSKEGDQRLAGLCEELTRAIGAIKLACAAYPLTDDAKARMRTALRPLAELCDLV